jgi:parvulin-like peptidyl-prolyl isomerase
MHVKELISRKLIFLDAKRTIPAANFPKVEEQMAEAWDKDVLKATCRKMGVDNPAQLDAKLREAGTTLEREKRNFVEQTLATQWLRTKINEDEEITHESMLQYYQAHIADYQVLAKAKWEHLMVRFDQDRSEQELYAKIAQMGNHLWSGVPWAEIARRESDGPTAPQGGLRDWTAQGSLISDRLDQALFTLPIGALSPIIKDDQGFHIVRVVERTDAGQISFSSQQSTIRDKIRDERMRQQRNDYVEKLKKGVTIWTIFDGEKAADMVSIEPPRPARKQ